MHSVGIVLLVGAVGGARVKSGVGSSNGGLPTTDNAGAPHPDTFAKCHLSESDCDLDDMSEPTMVYTDSDTSICWNGDPFAFMVRPGDREKLVFFIPGGGACWGTQLGDVSEELQEKLPAIDFGCVTNLEQAINNTGSFYGGLFDFDLPQNEFFRDYTLVAPAYCDGSLFIGNSVVETKNGTAFQYGFNNMMLTSNWVKKNFPGTLDSLLLTGISAGALGAQFWADHVLTILNYRKASVIADGYIGVEGNDNNNGELIKSWGTCETPLASAWRELCMDGNANIASIFEPVIAKFPEVAFAHVDSKGDNIQRIFSLALALSLADKDGLTMPVAEFYKKSNALREIYNKYPNWVTYIVEGNKHVFELGAEYWSTSTAGFEKEAPEGTATFREWVEALVSHEPVDSACSGTPRPNGWWFSNTYCDEALFPKTLQLETASSR